MQSILLIVHLMIALALVGTVLLQRSEGGALGMGGGGGGGGGMGGLMSGRGAASALTRTTAVLAAAFFATSIALSLISGSGTSTSVLDRIDSQTNTDGPLTINPDILGGGSTDNGAGAEAPTIPVPSGPSVPVSE